MGQMLSTPTFVQPSELFGSVEGGVHPTPSEAATWCKFFVRIAGAFAGAVAIISGLVTCLISDVQCIVGGVILILSSLVVLVFETPVLCTFIVNQTRPITEFAERRTCFEKAFIYIVLAVLSLVVCPSLSNLFGCGLIFAVGVIYGLMGIGRKADRQQQLREALLSSSQADETSVGLIDNEASPPVEPFVGQH